MEDSLIGLVGELVKDQAPFHIVVSTTDDWEFPLDPKITKVKSMVLSISGWALEQAYLDENNMLYIRLAFGDSENSKAFYFSEIHAVLDQQQMPLYQRVFDSTIKKEEYTLKSLIGMPPGDSPEGIRTSMDAMKKNNPGAFKKGES